MNFGQKLRELRKSKGLTQKELASILNITESNISGYERNAILVSTEIFIKYCIYFKVDANKLIELL